MKAKNKHPNRVICPKCGATGTKIQKTIKCGKPNCSKCPHGPYWYVTHRVKSKKHPTECYIGKVWPEEPSPAAIRRMIKTGVADSKQEAVKLHQKSCPEAATPI